MKFILNKRIKYYTKETFKWIQLIAVSLGIVMGIVLTKYKPVCAVSISGEQVGYVKSKNELENKIEEFMEQEGTQNIAFIDMNSVPEYQFTLVSHQQETSEEQIMSKIQETAEITYQYYAVTVDGEQKSIVTSLEEAENLVKELKEEHKQSTKIAEVSIREIYTKNREEYKTVDIKVAKEEVEKNLKQIEDATVKGVYLSQKPITGTITSRFGSRESIRTSSHLGLDIAAPYGTKIKAAAAGEVTWSGEMGSYGNLVIVNCGNGVEIYYGHCSKLYAKVGQKIEAGDIIAAVGSTGNSTGNHLHFEIKVNGTSVDPQKYIYN